MDSGNIFKIWGERRRILLNDLVEIDHLIIKKDTFCSWHYHAHKSNKFYVLTGKVKIKTEHGEVILKPNEYFDVHAPMKHQFIALEDSTMIEIAYLNIDPSDIIREFQGGKIVNGKHISEKDLK